MKTSTSILLLLPATLALGQRGYDRDRPRVEGLYESLQRDGSIRRTLRLEKDGTAEVMTEATGTRRDRNRWDDDDLKHYGKSGREAIKNRAVRHLGRWQWRDENVVVQLDDAMIGRDRWKNIEMRLDRKDGDLVFDRNTDAYGDNRIVFRRAGGPNGGRPPLTPRFGTARYDDETLSIESVDLIEVRDRDWSRLRIRAGGRTIEMEGRVIRDNGDVRFQLRDRAGEYRLTMRDDRVVDISGRGEVNGRRLDMVTRY